LPAKVDELAIHGGSPVRTTPLPAAYLGTSVYGAEELDLVSEVVRNRLPFREYGDGEPHMVTDLEDLGRQYFRMPFALATATGSGSFYCAMVGLGLGPGDEVIVPAFSWWTLFQAPLLVGVLPVFADIDRSLTLDPDDFERKITSNTKAVIVVHYQGAAGRLDRILEIATKRNIAVVEDCAQSCGATYQGEKLGSFGKVSCFSFQQNKIVSSGDGGMLLARDATVFERAVRFHDLGMMRPSLAKQLEGVPQVESFAGCQFRMNELTGAVALAQLRKLDGSIIGKTQRYFKTLKTYVAKNCQTLKLRETDEGDAGIAFYMDLETPQRAAWFSRALEAEGIRVGPSSGCCNLLDSDLVRNRVQAHPGLPPFGKGFAGEHVRYDSASCPCTNEIVASMVCVALVPRMTEADLADVSAAITKVWKIGLTNCLL